jgi:hypothetical protein
MDYNDRLCRQIAALNPHGKPIFFSWRYRAIKPARNPKQIRISGEKTGLSGMTTAEQSAFQARLLAGNITPAPISHRKDDIRQRLMNDGIYDFLDNEKGRISGFFRRFTRVSGTSRDNFRCFHRIYDLKVTHSCDGFAQSDQFVSVDLVSASETVDDMRSRLVSLWMSKVVRQLVVSNDGAIFVLAFYRS